MIRAGLLAAAPPRAPGGAATQLIADALTAKPVPVESLTAPGTAVPHDDLYRTVTATGRFDTAHEVVARRRTNADGEVGYHVLTPLVLDDGRAVLVNRGWIPAGRRPDRVPEDPRAPGRRGHRHRPADGRRDDRGQRHQGHARACPTARSC